MIHHEFNIKHSGFWEWNSRSRRSTVRICSKSITFRAELAAPYGIGYDCWPQSIQEKQWWGLGARRLAPHTHTLVSQTELLNKSQKCGLRQKLLYNIHDRIPLSVLISSEVLSCRYVTRYFRKIPTYSSEKSHQPTFWMEKGLEGPSHFSLAWNSRSCWKSLLKTPMSLNVTGVDFPVEKIWCDWRNQQRSKA